MLLRCGFEKGVSELCIKLGWPTVVERVRQYCTLFLNIQSFKNPDIIKDRLLLLSWIVDFKMLLSHNSTVLSVGL